MKLQIELARRHPLDRFRDLPLVEGYQGPWVIPCAHSGAEAHRHQESKIITIQNVRRLRPALSSGSRSVIVSRSPSAWRGLNSVTWISIKRRAWQWVQGWKKTRPNPESCHSIILLTSFPSSVHTLPGDACFRARALESSNRAPLSALDRLERFSGQDRLTAEAALKALWVVFQEF